MEFDPAALVLGDAFADPSGTVPGVRRLDEASVDACFSCLSDLLEDIS